MNIAQIESNVSDLVKEIVPESFIFDLLLAYGLPKASIARFKTGNLNLSKRSGEVSWKKKVLFREDLKTDLHSLVTTLQKEAKNEQRFVITTDYKSILAIDTKTGDKLDITIGELNKHFDFFLPWAGMEKSQHHDENPADVKAAERMAKLFDEIKLDNPDNSPEFIHSLNVFLSRLLFCYFAEDTNIFEKGQFTGAVSSHTQQDGSDLAEYLDKLFSVLNTPEKDRTDLPLFLSAFPYVNGGLFRLHLQTPIFTRRSRQALIDSGDMDWSSINPDIFGSMIQAVVTPENRGGLGMHYTSVPNIMKVIKPLFLDELYEEFEKAKGNPKKLNDLLERIYKIKIFDPACGSGNFLIISYKELRKLEMLIFKAGNTMPMSRISLGQFYGIEIDDFAHEIAQLSLWLAEHQMNVEFYKEFGKTNPTLPLKESGHIVKGNACRIDWESVCPKDLDSEIYILGNPPYLGARMQNDNQKEDLEKVFNNNLQIYKNLDYIACWFFLSANYIIGANAKSAFVSTNSISQGEQVSLLWPEILKNNIVIEFAYKSFKWQNRAKDNAAVIVVIIGLSTRSKDVKTIFDNSHKLIVKNISPYLINSNSIFVKRRNSSLSSLPPMPKGNMPYDGGNLILTTEEKNVFLEKFPNANKFIKQLMGSYEFINGIERWCFWIRNMDLNDALVISPIADRIEKVKTMRLNSTDAGAHKLAMRAHQFREINETTTSSIILPSVSSENREYIPMGFIGSNVIVTNLAFAIYDVQSWCLGVLSSKMHMVWVRTVGGRLKSDYRYSSELCYNTFPFPKIIEVHENELIKTTLHIIEEREKHPEKTLAELYDPDKMPDSLREAHHQNDLAVERCYRSKPFTSDEERLEYLFNLYEQMIEEEKNIGTLFESVSLTHRKKAGKKKA